VNVIHCFRSPTGGLFRHVQDLVRYQAAHGLRTGIICDSGVSSEQIDDALDSLADCCELGIHRIRIKRRPGLADFRAIREAENICLNTKPDIIHGHGAKGGAYSRLLARRITAHSIYTPHGGALHYNPLSLSGAVYFYLERLLRPNTDAMIFESQFSAQAYEKKIGSVTCNYKVIHNGLADSEMSPVKNTDNPADFIFLGEFRKLKGIDTLLEAIAIINKERPLRVVIAGAGGEHQNVVTQIENLGLGNCITLSAPIFPITEAFRKAKFLIVPSRAESLPYIVLEAAAAQMPIIATNVGGIAEIFGPYSERLINADAPLALAAAMREVLNNPDDALAQAEKLYNRVRSSFRIDHMGNDVDAFYKDILLHQTI
jgi:glycosyltransferase involved in cell wall biosynthesis